MREAVHRACVDPGVLRVHFQPIVDLARGVVTGYEALSRFNGPPQATPDVWFAAAHRFGVGERLEARALAAALEARASLPPNCFLTVNVGPAALMAAEVQDVLLSEGDLRGLVIEVTEQQPVDDYAALNAVLAPMRAGGALLAVDDAGAGFSSLKHIMALRPDLVKVDRGLVAGIDADETKAAVVETLGIFASRLDAWLLAEGVETTAELERLLDLRVPLGQGYGLGRPSPAMAGADPEAAATCRRRADLGARGELAGLAQAVPRVPAGADAGRVADAFLRHRAAAYAALVDEFDRPVALVARGGGIRARRRLAPLCVTAAERLTDVVRRAVTRPAEERLVPVAVCDEQSRLIGLVPVERLLERLADAVDGEPARTIAAGARRTA